MSLLTPNTQKYGGNKRIVMSCKESEPSTNCVSIDIYEVRKAIYIYILYIHYAKKTTLKPTE